MATQPLLDRKLLDVACSCRRLDALLLGQGISVLITGTAVFSSQLAVHGVDVPVTQSSLNYALLSLHLLWALAREGLWTSGLAAPLWQYALWALIDIEANYLVVAAFQYTSAASVTLLDCFAIPVAMALSRCALGARYTWRHLAAVAICLFGLVLTVVSDVDTGRISTVAPKGPSWLGDLIILLGATLYGCSNVFQEYHLKNANRRCEVLGMLGLFGSIISFVQAAVLERSQLESYEWPGVVVWEMLGFQLCMFGVYVLTSVFLLFADAAVLNLSVLTSDLFSMIYTWRVQGRPVTLTYGAAFVATLSGVGLYFMQPPVAGPQDGARQGVGTESC